MYREVSVLSVCLTKNEPSLKLTFINRNGMHEKIGSMKSILIFLSLNFRK
jgi:hypothetical protein